VSHDHKQKDQQISKRKERGRKLTVLTSLEEADRKFDNLIWERNFSLMGESLNSLNKFVKLH
jgi:hypothetical protein